MGSLTAIEKFRDSSLRAIMFLVFLVFCGPGIMGQESVPGKDLFSGEQYTELFELFTDRSTYIAGEEIHFSIFNLSPQEMKNPLWSQILYIELLSQDNQVISRQKLKLSDHGAFGSIRLSKNPASGYYYLRAYTRWMRNFPAENYPVYRIRIINPYSQDVLGLVNGDEQSHFSPEIESGNEDLRINLKTDRLRYGTREKVSISASLMEDVDVGGLCLTVVPRGAEGGFGSVSYKQDPLESQNAGAVSGSIFIPETRGMALSGKVVNGNNGDPVPNSRVQLSLIGENPDYFGYLTGKDGIFHIALPDYTGVQDFYISAETAESERIDILVDQDFCTRYPVPQSFAFDISPGEKTLLEEMMLNAQVMDIYRVGGFTPDSIFSQVSHGKYFYGEPWFSIKIDEYVKLPTLEEFIFELIPQTRVRKRGGKAGLVMQGNYSDLAIYSPLILLDHVAVTDISTILNVSPEKIESIDLINATYIRGNINYGGILSITSKKRDLAGIELPEDSYFFNFNTLSDYSAPRFPDYNTGPGDLRSPDFRNCLYWDPNVTLDQDGGFEGEFHTSDRAGEYILLFRGFTTDGFPISGSTVILVD